MNQTGQWSALVILTAVNLPEAVPYYCMRCRSKMFHINREILTIYMGEGYPANEIPRNMGLVEVKCRSCPQKYSFYFQ